MRGRRGATQRAGGDTGTPRCVLWLLLASVSVLGPMGSNALAQEAVERIERRCLAALERIVRDSFPGGSAAVILPDGKELAFAVGYADVEAQRKMTPSDRFMSASIGKTYLGAMVLHLAAQGLLELDVRAASFFEGEEWFKRLPNAAEFTVRQLLRHESGLPRYVVLPEFWKALVEAPDRRWTPKDCLEYVFDAGAVHSVGKGWAYSDTNYIVVGMIAEKVSGKSLGEYVKQHFLERLGLRDTELAVGRRQQGLVQGYVKTSTFQRHLERERLLDSEGRMPFNPEFEYAGGGYVNTPLDLARWARLLYSGKAFEGQYLDEMLDTVPARLGPNGSYGISVMVRETAAGQMLGHDGNYPGFTSTMGYFPELQVAGAFQVNTCDPRSLQLPMHRLLVECADIVKEELGG